MSRSRKMVRVLTASSRTSWYRCWDHNGAANGPEECDENIAEGARHLAGLHGGVLDRQDGRLLRLPDGLRVMGAQRTFPTRRTLGRSAAVVGTAALCSVLMAATPALAADWIARAAGSSAETWYRDYTGFTDDLIVVTDRVKDGHGAVGWIEVKQADGSWNRFPKIYNGNGYKTSVSVRQDVLREGAQVKVVSCLQDGVGGSPYNCGIAYGGGNSAY